MPQVFADPEELKNFANRLDQYITTLETETGNLAGGFANLGDTWQDEKKAAFEEQFTALMVQIDAFKASCEEQVPYLRRLADILIDYKNS